jgi:hypothetical protein
MRTKILGLAFLAILAINAIALTATASAVEVLLTNFLPEPTKEKPVTFTNSSNKIELVPLGEVLEGAKTVQCKKSKSTGELTTSKLGKGTITFEECKLGIVAGENKCEDLTEKKPGIIVSKGAFHIQTAEEGLKTPVKVPALVVLPDALHFTCGIVSFLILQSPEDPSCVAGRILEENKLLKELKVLFIEDPEAAGDPNILKVYDDNDKEYKCLLFFNLSEGKLLTAAINAKEEVKLTGCKQGGNECTMLIDF